MGEILWRGADHRAVADEISRPEADSIGQNRMGLDRAVIADEHMILDDREGSDFNIFSKAGRGADESGGMDFQNGRPISNTEGAAV